MRKDHGEHNERVCDLLLERGEFPDWVVTTAFYASLQFVNHQIFPLHIGDDEYETFEEYFAKKAKKDKPTITKHAATIDLVRTQFYIASSAYQFLHDMCHSARYNDYRVNPSIAIAARERLKFIRDRMTK